MYTVFAAPILLAVIAAAFVTHVMINREKILRQCNALAKAIFWLFFIVLVAISIPPGFLFGGTLGGGVGALLANMIGVPKPPMGMLSIILGIFLTTFLLLEVLTIILAMSVAQFVSWKRAQIGR
jgi:hypothetical protein